jgi:hypothetical protein
VLSRIASSSLEISCGDNVNPFSAGDLHGDLSNEELSCKHFTVRLSSVLNCLAWLFCSLEFGTAGISEKEKGDPGQEFSE